MRYSINPCFTLSESDCMMYLSVFHQEESVDHYDFSHVTRHLEKKKLEIFLLF